MNIHFGFIFVSGLICSSSLAQVPRAPAQAPTTQAQMGSANTNSEKYFAYPELQVSPRASERVLMEARAEGKNQDKQLLPLQFSALMTLLAGASAGKPEEEPESSSPDVNRSRQVAMGVGLSWLVFSYFFNENYAPYTKAHNTIKSMPSGSGQEQLVRERIAEEHIQAASSLGKKIMWASTITNLAAAGYLGGHASKQGKVYAAVAGIMAFAPIVFRDNWQTVNEYHQDYKKRIYGPIAMPALLTGPQVATSKTYEVTPGIIWHWNF